MAEVTKYTIEDDSDKFDSAKTEFKKISPDDEAALEWYSKLQLFLNREQEKDTIYITQNISWNHDNAMYVFVSYFSKSEKESEQGSQKRS